MLRLSLSIILLLRSALVFSQAVIGDAEQLTCNCYKLTDAVNTQAGAVWNSTQLDLSDPFDFTFDVYLGNIPGGADGIAFVLQPVDTSQLTPGGGMGYEGISPSLAMSIDTYDNGANDDDIVADHVAVMSNGSVEHFSADNLAGPEIALVSGANIENGAWHLMRISWDPTSNTINFYMDGSLRLTYSGDIVNDIFGGDPNVYWGFTGSTGGLNNRQEFCFSIIPGLTSNDTEICAGEAILFEDDSYSALGDVVGWNWDFDNGVTSIDESPGEITFEDAGQYTVSQTIEDAEGCTATEDLTITVNPNPEADFSASQACEGDASSFVDQSSVSVGSLTDWDWDLGDGTTDFGNSISATYNEAGTYDVQLVVATNEGCIDSTTVSVEVFEPPVAEGQIESNSLDATLTTGLEVGEEAFWVIQDTSFTTDGELAYSFPDSGFYDISLIVTNANGCTDTADYTIYVEGLPEYEVPNVFTPNGDDVNEMFSPETYGVSEAVMEIFNRWGRPVFTYEGAVVQGQWGWDGSINGGAKAAAGTYYYVLNLKGVNGDNFAEKGTVTLVR